jgi:hypothetical protein
MPNLDLVSLFFAVSIKRGNFFSIEHKILSLSSLEFSLELDLFEQVSKSNDIGWVHFVFEITERIIRKLCFDFLVDNSLGFWSFSCLHIDAIVIDFLL